jgi:ubiquitin C-terminal hydrolase
LFDNLNDLFEITKNCDVCQKDGIHLEKIKYNFEKLSFLIIRLNRFNLIGKKISNSKTKILNLDTNKIVVQNKEFKMKTAVLYHGNLDNGHYECVMRNNSQWIKISDKYANLTDNPSISGLCDVSYMILEKI